MNIFSVLLIVATIIIYLLTANASFYHGPNWPAVAIEDLFALNWRTQFDFDFLIHLFLMATWISWRERFSTKGFFYGFLSIFLGGMFSFPYLTYLMYSTNCDYSKILMGDNFSKS